MASLRLCEKNYSVYGQTLARPDFLAEIMNKATSDGKRVMAANMTGLKAPIVTTAESKFLLPIPLRAGG